MFIAETSDTLMFTHLLKYFFLLPALYYSCGQINQAASIDSMSVDAFEEACAEFDRITPLDPLKTELLLKIKT